MALTVVGDGRGIGVVSSGSVRRNAAASADFLPQ